MATSLFDDDESGESASDDDMSLDPFMSSSDSTEYNEPDHDISSPCSSDSEDTCTSVTRSALIAMPPEVLEPCHHIIVVPGVAEVSKHSYRICGDNIDKTVKCRYMRLDKRNESLHYFNSYAVLNRIDISHLSDVCVDSRSLSPSHIAYSVLPSSIDDRKLRENITILVSRVLVTHLHFFSSTFQGAVDWHIKHQFYQEMSTKSHVVSIQPCRTCSE